MTDEKNILVRPLEDCAVLITGGTSGIGLASARALAEAGVRCFVLNGRNADRAEAARRSLAKSAPEADIRLSLGDAATQDGARGAVMATTDAFGHIDVLLNSAGGDILPKLLHETDMDEIESVLQGELLSTILPTRAALDPMMAQRGGSIIAIASDAAKVATPGEAVIGAALAGILMFTRTAAMEAKRSGVRLNCITPSIVRGTSHYDKLMADGFAGRLFAKAESRANLGVVEAEDLAHLVVYLASPAAAKLSGQGISLNGGITAA
ncbi:MAG: SDR family oxidoreductase [Alphaproteobacteria bacterium]|jgi:NAD(P)-dependent dehydrogenase (short-subunit alcohol dehydrogenase family)|nr:short-chain dehydrogenase [Rhodospirillaceae bacterium]MDP6406718.1 SDR family oxidoreductase [Alphaproteobacteria bacterium]MDP6621177.1 SDR family oxidoreductase [Alphaproteobacteria bacterium]|tara:strand:- start:502 stop:1299 length:798 start_codon:yes stop_codon:yes gene_type:complete